RCHSSLRIRPSYIGHRVNCKRCAHLFRARVDGEGQTAGESGANGETPMSPEEVGRKYFAKLISRNEKYVLLKQRFKESRERCSQFAGLVQALRSELDRVYDESEPNPTLSRALEEIPAGYESLDSWLCELQERTTVAERQVA